MAQPTVQAHREPPPVGRNVPVRVTDDFRNDLAELMRHGQSATGAIRAAVRIMADAYRRAHDYGDVPRDQAPRITSAHYTGERLPCRHTVGGSSA